MKKSFFVIVVLVLALTLSCFAGCDFNFKNRETASAEDKIAIVENAQYLPSKELLVDKAETTAGALAEVSEVFSPYSLLDGGISENEYDYLVQMISPIDTPFDRSFTIRDARDEMIDILSEGIIYDEWYQYDSGEMSGEGSFYVTGTGDSFSITRCSSFQPWVYESEYDRFVGNDELGLDKPNYPIRSDNYLRLSFYEENDKEVVECEVVENLSYYDEVSIVSYQFLRNVRDTSFTKIQLVFRNTLPNPEDIPSNWGFDIDTVDDYSYIRSFTQIDYSSPDDIKWLRATQSLPYAFNASGTSNIEYASRENGDGFYYALNTVTNPNGSFSLTPDEEYLSIDFNDYYSFQSESDRRTDDSAGSFIKAMYSGNYSVACDIPQDYAYFENKLSSIAEVLDSLSTNACDTQISEARKASLVFCATNRDAVFETAINTCLDDITKAAVASSDLANEYKNNDVYNMTPVTIIPLSAVPQEKTE